MIVTRLKQVRPLTLFLGAVNLCLFALLAYTSWQGTQTNSLLQTPAKPFPLPELKLDPPTPRPSLAALKEEPLFYATRRLYTPPSPSIQPLAPPKPDYRLVGTFIIPSKPTVALLTNTSGASRKVKTGDELDGWTVQSVGSGSVILQYQTQTLEISSSTATGKLGMRVVPLSRTAQLAPAGGVRALGSPTLDPSLARRASSSSIPVSPISTPRLYQPPPK